LPPVSSPPHRLSPQARRSAGKKFSQIWARPPLGSDPRHSFWLSENRSIARRSGRIVALENTFARLVRVACWFMYVRTYKHTYIHTYMYIFIYRYIFGYLFFFGPGTKETRITLSLFLSFGRKIFEKWKEVARFVQILKYLENLRS